MKMKFKLPVILVSLLCMYACETETILEDNTEKNNKLIDGKTLLNRADEIDLENRMQWVSYMTAQVLLRSDRARQQFMDELGNSGASKAFSLGNLIDSNVQDSSFRDEFRGEFYFHYEGVEDGGVCDHIGKPKGGPKPPGSIGGDHNDNIGGDNNDNTVNYIEFDMYVNSLLNDDCLEFYLPNGFLYIQLMGTSSGPSFIKSTAHPLTDAISNEGYNHIAVCDVSDMTVYDNTAGVIVVIRPVGDDIDCTYDEYLVPNFEDFLD